MAYRYHMKRLVSAFIKADTLQDQDARRTALDSLGDRFLKMVEKSAARNKDLESRWEALPSDRQFKDPVYHRFHYSDTNHRIRGMLVQNYLLCKGTAEALAQKASL